MSRLIDTSMKDTQPVEVDGQAIASLSGHQPTTGRESGSTELDSLDDYTPDPTFIHRIPIAYARQHGVIGLTRDTDDDDASLLVAVADLSSWEIMDVLSRFLDTPVEPIIATENAIMAKIDDAYQKQSGQAQAMVDHLDRKDVLAELDQLPEREDLLDTSGRAPVIRLVNLMLFEAVQQGASDIHLQPHEEGIAVRLRIDGVLFDIFELSRHLLDEIVSRIKVMGKMNIAEKRLAQDGRTTVEIGKRHIDLRISSIPTSFGERVVIRLLDKSARLYRLAELGMDEDVLSKFRGGLIGIEHGLVLVTGPTGSGKSTTLYAALQEINSKEKNILTLEDPIEYQLPGVSQTQVSDRKGMTFASGLRSVLRQDPDIIMVGEIRDQETAIMAIQSALTGHLVFSTLHTNDAASAVTRLLDLGIEPYLVSSSLVGVLAQRLVRRVCTDCLSHLDDGRGSGCESCRQTGFRGRAGLFELLTVDDDIRGLIQSRSAASTIKQAAISNGMLTLREDGLRRIELGETTLSEVSRVTAQLERNATQEDEI